MRVLLIGFGPFPGAPLNPSALLVKSLAAPAAAGLRRNRADVPRIHDHYAAVDRDLAKLRETGADIVLMFGLAGRRRHLCIETRARNAVSLLFPDASGFRPQRGVIAPRRAWRAARRSAVRPPARRGARERGSGAVVARCRPLSVQLRLLARAGAGERWPAAGAVHSYSARLCGSRRRRPGRRPPGSTPSLRLANASSLRSSRQAAVNRAGRIVTCAEPECGSATA